MPDTDFRLITPDALVKERFVIVDAVRVTEHDYVDAAPLDRVISRFLWSVCWSVAANFSITADEVTTVRVPSRPP